MHIATLVQCALEGVRSIAIAVQVAKLAGCEMAGVTLIALCVQVGVVSVRGCHMSRKDMDAAVFGGGQGRVSVLGGMPGNRDMHAGRGDVHSHSEGIADSSMSGQKSHPSAHGKTTNQSIQRDNVCS